jgi:hypothetical protein
MTTFTQGLIMTTFALAGAGAVPSRIPARPGRPHPPGSGEEAWEALRELNLR